MNTRRHLFMHPRFLTLGCVFPNVRFRLHSLKSFSSKLKSYENHSEFELDVEETRLQIIYLFRLFCVDNFETWTEKFDIPYGDSKSCLWFLIDQRPRFGDQKFAFCQVRLRFGFFQFHFIHGFGIHFTDKINRK